MLGVLVKASMDLAMLRLEKKHALESHTSHHLLCPRLMTPKALFHLKP